MDWTYRTFLVLIGLSCISTLSAQQERATERLFATLDSAVSVPISEASAKEGLLRSILKDEHAKSSDSLMLRAHLELGKLLFYTSQFDSAYTHFVFAESFAEKSIEQRASLENMQGAALQRLERLEAAATHFLNSAELYEELNDLTGAAKVYNNLSIAYQSMRDFDGAKEYIRRAIRINSQKQDSLRLGQNFNNLGNVFNALNELDSALYYFRKSADIKSKYEPESSQMASSLNNIGLIYQQQKKYLEAKAFYERALELRQKANDRYGQTSVSLNLIELLVDLKEYQEAEDLYEQVAADVEHFGNFEMLTRYKTAGGRIYQGLGDPNKSVELLLGAMEYSDSLHRQTTKVNVLELEKRYRLGEKEAEIRRLEEQRIQEAKEAERNFIFIIVLSALTLVLVILGAVNIRRLRIINALNKEYLHEKERVENIVLFKERTLRTLSHEVRTPLNGIVSLTEMLQSEDLSEKQREILDLIGISTDRLMKVITNVLDYSKFQAGSIEYTPERVDLANECKQIVKSFEAQAQLQQLDLQYEGPDKLNFIVNTQLLHSVLNNLIGNAIKFTPVGGHIALRISGNEEQVTIEVEDSGIGMTEEQLSKIFVPFSQVSEEVERRILGTGLGLAIVKDFTELMGGQVSAKSKEGESSTFTVHLSTS